MQYQYGISGELKQAWGGFLTELGDRNGGWDWWTTLTFRDPPEDKIRQGWTKVGWGYAWRAFDRFLGFLRLLGGVCEPSWVVGMEYQKWRGVPHLHSLIGGVECLRRDEAWEWWFKHYGLARIEPYDRKQGAGFYLCKYVVKDLADIRFSDNLTR